MARKTQWREPERPADRTFTGAELERIRELTAVAPSRADGHPRRQTSELERIWKATGRRRPFMLWELDYVHDARAAFEEETNPRPPEYWSTPRQSRS